MKVLRIAFAPLLLAAACSRAPLPPPTASAATRATEAEPILPDAAPAAISVLPDAASPAIRVLVRAGKGGRAPLLLHPAMVLGDGQGRDTAEARAVLGGRAALPLPRASAG